MSELIFDLFSNCKQSECTIIFLFFKKIKQSNINKNYKICLKFTEYFTWDLTLDKFGDASLVTCTWDLTLDKFGDASFTDACDSKVELALANVGLGSPGSMMTNKNRLMSKQL